jgi:hypothetical protein
VYSEEQPGEAATALFIKQVSSQDAGLYRYNVIYRNRYRRCPARMMDCTGTVGFTGWYSWCTARMLGSRGTV